MEKLLIHQFFVSDFSNRKNRTKTHDFKCEYKNKPNKNLEKVNMPSANVLVYFQTFHKKYHYETKHGQKLNTTILPAPL